METMEIAVWLRQIINANVLRLAAAEIANVMGNDDDLYKTVIKVESPAIYVLPRLQVGHLADATELVASEFVLGNSKRLALMVGAMAAVLGMKGLNDQFSVAVLDKRTKDGFSFDDYALDTGERQA